MFDASIEDMRSGIGHERRDIFWAKLEIHPNDFIAHYMGGRREYVWQTVGREAAQNIFEMINDGELYCIRVKKFKSEYLLRLIEQPDFFQGAGHLGLPELSLGYRGSISLVQVEPFRIPEPTPLDYHLTWVYQTPTWTEIRDGIVERLKENFKPNNLAKWFIKNVLARVLYMPDTNPEFWGVDAF